LTNFVLQLNKSTLELVVMFIVSFFLKIDVIANVVSFSVTYLLIG